MGKTILSVVVAVLTLQIASQAKDKTSCTNMTPKKNELCFYINTADPTTQGLRQANVISGDHVYIELKSRPVEKCSVQLKTEAIAPPPSPFAQFLKTVKLSAAKPSQDACAATADANKPAGNPAPALAAAVSDFDKGAQVLYIILRDLNGQIIAEEQSYYLDVPKRLDAFAKCQDLQKKDVCQDRNTFEAAAAEMRDSLAATLTNPIPTTTVAEFQFGKLQDSLTKITDPAWFANKASQLSCYSAEIAGAKAHLADLANARQNYAKLFDTIRTIGWADPKDELIPPQKNAKVTATVSCTNLISGDPSIDPVNVIASYQDVPLATSTVGVLLTLTPKQVIGTSAVKTGEMDGVPTFKNVFAVTSSAPVQIVPFTFLNVRLHYWRIGSRILTGNVAGGIGVNPNSGTNQVEYFAGTSFGIGGLSIDFGAHIGVIQNLGGGFSLGETVPPMLTVPVKKSYTTHPAFGFTYILPLP